MEDKAIQTVIRALSGAVRCYDHRYRKAGFEICDNGKPVTVTYEPLPDYHWVKRKAGSEVIEPEVLPPERPALNSSRTLGLPLPKIGQALLPEGGRR